jgi:hypothetical protein
VEPTKVYAPRSNPRPTPTPPTWTAPRSNPPPEIAKEGAALAKRLLAERQRPPGAPSPRPRTDDERRAFALAQARQSRREREPTLTQEAAAAMTAPAEPEIADEPGEPPDEIPF